MTLTHIPAHTSHHPDRYIDVKTGLGYSVCQDAGAEDPRQRIGDEHAALFTYRGPRGDADAVPDNVAAQAFDRYWQKTNDEDKALNLTRRYLALFHPEKKIAVTISTIRGYSQGDWREVFVAVSDDYGKPENHVEEFSMWAFGDVWIVIPDGKAGISGIHAEDAEAALTYFRENFEDDTPLDTESSNALSPLTTGGPYRVSWSIDGEEDFSPAQVALHAWQRNFRRGAHQPNPDEACVFTVLDQTTGRSVDIDLSDARFAHLFR